MPTSRLTPIPICVWQVARIDYTYDSLHSAAARNLDVSHISIGPAAARNLMVSRRP
jgi:hypothetical protein